MIFSRPFIRPKVLATGKAVVATNWSGNKDFMCAETASLAPYKLVDVADRSGVYADSSAPRWAELDVPAVGAMLQALAGVPRKREVMGSAPSSKDLTARRMEKGLKLITKRCVYVMKHLLGYAGIMMY